MRTHTLRAAVSSRLWPIPVFTVGIEQHDYTSAEQLTLTERYERALAALSARRGRPIY